MTSASEPAEVDPALAAGLADTPEQPVEERTVDTSREKDDDESGDHPQPEGAVVHHLPVRLEEPPPDQSFGGLIPVAEELRGIASLAVTLAMAQVVPKALRDKPADVLAVLLTGRELGVAPMTAIRTFHVIDGSVTVAPKMRAAMVRERGLGKLWPHQPPQVSPCPALGPDHDGEDCLLCAGTNAVVKLCRCGRDDEANDGEQATWHGERGDQPGVIFSSTFTAAMAGAVEVPITTWANGNKTTRVGSLLDKDNWKNYRPRMLSWRSLGYLLDDAFPEVGTGIYSPDEIGAVTDEEGQPILDVESTETLVPRSAQGAKNDQRRASQEAAQNTPANPADVQRFKDRIAKLDEWDGAAAKLKELWTARDEQGNQKVPPLNNPAFAYRHQVLASAMIDSVERMCDKGLFTRKDEAAAEGQAEQPEPEGGEPPAEAPEGGEEPAEGEPEPGGEQPPAFDASGLPEGHSHGDDLQWVERAPEAMVDECIAHVKSLDSEEVNSRLHAAKIQRRGSESDRRERLTCHMIRARLERSAKR